MLLLSINFLKIFPLKKHEFYFQFYFFKVFILKSFALNRLNNLIKLRYKKQICDFIWIKKK